MKCFEILYSEVFKIRDRHQCIHHQILRQNEGLILILAQS